MPRRVFVSEHGTAFTRQIAERLVEALVIAGHDAQLVTDELPSVLHAGGDPLEQLVVAPHEFFPLFRCSDGDRDRAATHSVSINTQREGMPSFDVAMQFAAMGPMVFDVNVFSLDAVRRAGLQVVHLPLGHVPSMDHWRGDSRARSIDIGFHAARTAYREVFIGGAAGQLWEWHTDLRFSRRSRSEPCDGIDITHATIRCQTLADTRILLNVHRSAGDSPFEWARLVEAIANGCVVATETSAGIEPFVAGQHLLMAPFDDLAEEAIALAFDEPRRERMARAAHELLTRSLSQPVLVERALTDARGVLGIAASARSGRNARGHPARRASRRPDRSVADRPPMTAERQMLVKTAKDLKEAYLAQVDSVRAIERSLAVARFGDADHIESFSSPAYDQTRPRVSVVVPVHNQGSFAVEAIESVAAASGSADTPVELIVVDDHSTDDSLVIARQLLEQWPWLPWLMVCRAANGGPSVARNTGFARARAPYVFALDADNVLYPNGLRVLAEHLDASPSTTVAAYGLLERFDDRGAVGLTSHLPWDVDLLLHEGYIDTMAMFRLQAWSDLGGFFDPPGVGGWEGHDFWLSVAERSWRADLVPRIVGRYREHRGSMRSITDIDTATNYVVLRERHPRLRWPS